MQINKCIQSYLNDQASCKIHCTFVIHKHKPNQHESVQSQSNSQTTDNSVTVIH